jgi:hypothetical protein
MKNDSIVGDDLGLGDGSGNCEEREIKQVISKKGFNETF